MLTSIKMPFRVLWLSFCTNRSVTCGFFCEVVTLYGFTRFCSLNFAILYIGICYWYSAMKMQMPRLVLKDTTLEVHHSGQPTIVTCETFPTTLLWSCCFWCFFFPSPESKKRDGISTLFHPRLSLRNTKSAAPSVSLKAECTAHAARRYAGVLKLNERFQSSYAVLYPNRWQLNIGQAEIPKTNTVPSPSFSL